MTHASEFKPNRLLLPGERTLDRLRFRSYYRPCELILTDRRVLVFGFTGALGPQLTLLRGKMAAGFLLADYESFILGSGKRPLLLLAAVALAVAGGIMFTWPMARYGALVALALAAMLLLLWTAWPRNFFSLSARGFKVSGRANPREAVIFLERLQLAALAARPGAAPDQVRAAALLSGSSQALESKPIPEKNRGPKDDDPGPGTSDPEPSS